MTQKIDFLVFLKKPQKNFFTTKKIALYLLIFCLFLLLLILAHRNHVSTLEKSVKELEQKFNTLQQQIAEKNKSKVILLEDRLMAYKEANKLGFNGLADFLQKISEINLCGLWLTQFEISDGGRHVGLHGQFYQKELAFKYQQALQQWPLLSDHVLTLSLTGPTKQEQPFQFSMIWDKRENA